MFYRCWSVDFNSVDTKLLASGSDDARVKLWSANINHSVASLEAKVGFILRNVDFSNSLNIGTSASCKPRSKNNLLFRPMYAVSSLTQQAVTT